MILYCVMFDLLCYSPTLSLVPRERSVGSAPCSVRLHYLDLGIDIQLDGKFDSWPARSSQRLSGAIDFATLVRWL